MKEYSLHSMTGFGRASAELSGTRVTVEIRSVNSRYLEARFKGPRNLVSLESEMKKNLQKLVHRGTVEIVIALQARQAKKTFQVNQEVLAEYISNAETISKNYDLSSGFTASSLMRMPGVVEPIESNDEIEDEVKDLVLSVFDSAVNSLVEMRAKEGEKLGKVLLREINEIKFHRDWIYKHKEELNSRYLTKLKTRMKEWMGKVESNLDDTRLYQEVAFYLDRSDTTEELDRLASHLKQFDESLVAKGAKSIGKRLEFLSQEIGREINTIGAKTDHSSITNHVVEMKLTLEKIREQVQNLE
ncbi:MAG: YicC family protein [Oligoflexia bacterium]|nr:YicC family protein [Oligoflexia bacterium]